MDEESSDEGNIEVANETKKRKVSDDEGVCKKEMGKGKALGQELAQVKSAAERTMMREHSKRERLSKECKTNLS